MGVNAVFLLTSLFFSSPSQKDKVNTENNDRKVTAKKVRKLNYKNGIASKKGLNQLPVFVLFFFAVLLYASILFFVVSLQNIQTTPQNKMAVSALGSGSCGNNVTYRFDSSTGVLTISGTGEMKDYYGSSSSPFYNKSEIKSITIKTGVTSIGDSAFSGCTGLTSIAIPDSVKSIGYNAFSGCSGLTSISVSSGNIKYNSRNNCNAIIETSTNTLIVGCKSTIIPSSVTSIDYAAFSGCTGLTSIVIPDSVTSIGGSAFKGCTGLTSVIIGSGVTSIGDSAFYDCSGLTSIAIPNSLTSIDDYAFEGFSGLTSIVIPDGVTSISSIALNYVYEVTIIGSGDTTKTAFTYAKYRGINYATAWVKSDSSTHTRTFYGFRADRNATAVTQTENHNFGDADICSVCGAVKEVSIKIDVTTNVSRGFVIYILDSSNQPIRQFVVTNGDEINFTIVGSSAFTIQVYEILYMRAKIDNVDAFKRKYENLTVNTTIAIDIIGVMNVNNWVMI